MVREVCINPKRGVKNGKKDCIQNSNPWIFCNKSPSKVIKNKQRIPKLLSLRWNQFRLIPLFLRKIDKLALSKCFFLNFFPVCHHWLFLLFRAGQIRIYLTFSFYRSKCSYCYSNTSRKPKEGSGFCSLKA